MSRLIDLLEDHMQRRTFLSLSLAGLGTRCMMAQPKPTQFIPNPSKERWAVLFGTWCGTARDAGIWISEGMGGIAEVIDIREVPKDLTTYDHLVIGTSIRAGKGRQEMENFIKSNAGKLRRKIRGLYACCGNMGKPPGPQQTKDYIDNYLAKLCRVDSVPSRVFGGRITKVITSPEDYRTVEGLYRSLKMTLEDYDNLSRGECLELGKQILAGTV
jgi:menaquinone-dependent protoporphyrinogen IX oxidase